MEGEKDVPGTADPDLVLGEPTKDLFISMLTRDIELVPAIVDLVDNCVDGARRLRPNYQFAGLWVRLEVSAARFRIVDNCGGIDLVLARSYAFRFGRPEGMPTLPHMTGQFGVGMKRALFKLGKKFRIESKASHSRFVLDVDVDQWRLSAGWGFRFQEREENIDVPEADRGTNIAVEPLHESVSQELGLENFQTRLFAEIALREQSSIESGLIITLNAMPVTIHPPTLLRSDHVKPAHRKVTLRSAGKPEITVELFAGLGASDPAKAGWYVFCNGRMVIGADQTNATGWGEGGGKTIPKYHNQFATFRGFVLFDCADGGLLPWNTTKTGVDLDSRIYRAVKLDMTTIMRPIIDFLNKWKEERDDEPEEQPLQAIIDSGNPTPLQLVPLCENFETAEVPPQPYVPPIGHILYNRPVSEIDRVKKALKVRTNKEVGERTFDYFLKTECDE